MKRIQNYSISHLVGGLSFEVLRHANVDRCNTAFSYHGGLKGWTPAQWAVASAGEMGELCNLIKKDFRGRRGDNITKQMISDEIADVVIYLDLLAARMGISLGKAVEDKFNEVSRKTKSHIRI